MTKRRGPGRPRKSDTDTSAAIADAARRRFATRGYEATSLREIASDANIDVALIAYRFGGKAGLWKSIVSQSAKDLQAALHQAMTDTQAKPARERLRHAMRAFIDYQLAHPDMPRLLLRDITIDFDRKEAGYSPDRLDALVWALTELLASTSQAPTPSVGRPYGWR